MNADSKTLSNGITVPSLLNENYLQCRTKTVTISEERKARVKDLYFNEKMTTRDIAKTQQISLRDISDVLKQEEVKQQESENDKRQQKQQEMSAKAYELFSKSKTHPEIAIALNLRDPEVSKMQSIES